MVDYQRQVEIKRHLTGLTIDPAVVTSILREEEAKLAAKGRVLNDPAASPGPVKFDGTGRIEGFRAGSLSPELIARLEAAVIKPLAATRSEAPAEAPRPARSTLTVAMYLLRHDESPEGKALMADARKLFLSGKFNRESVAAFFDEGVKRMSNNELLRGRLEELAAEVKKPVTTPQLADNLYGRTFESLLVQDLVRDPPKGVLKAAHELGAGVLDALADMYPSHAPKVIDGIARQVRADWRIWYGQSPTLKEFARKPSIETLRTCLAETSNGFEAIKIPFIATHMCRTMNTEFPDSLPSWLSKADKFYWASVVSQKPQDKSALSDGERGAIEAREPGNWLHYQPSVSEFEMTGRGGKNQAHNRVVAPNAAEPGAPGGFVKDALNGGQTVVNGASGQTSLLTFFGQHLAKVNPSFPMGDHHLNTLMAMVFDGGHSTEEVLYTVDAIEKAPQSWLESLAALLNCSPDAPLRGYEAIATLSDNNADEQALRQRLDKALDKTLDYYDNHVAEANTT